jgi:L-ribulose-5-phosphate 3-epimerase
MYLGYNTNGFAHHRLEDALHLLAEFGYRGVALTLDYHVLDPYDPNLAEQLTRTEQILRQYQLRCVIETGARFLLDPRRKHQPTLLSARAEERERRLDFLRRAITIARRLGADVVSFWSGRADEPAPRETLLARLVDGCRQLCDRAADRGVRLAFEPEPGMFIDTMPAFAELQAQVAHPALGLTLDIGHLYCLHEEPAAPHIQRWRDLLWNVHLEDMRRGVHDHLMFGEGEIDFTEVRTALEEVHYAGGVHIELSRHSHDAVATAQRSLQFLRERGWPATKSNHG